MNSTPDPKEAASQDAPTGRPDERLAHAYEEIKRADEQLTRMSEQLAKIEGGAARPPAAGRWSERTGRAIAICGAGIC